MAPEAAAATSTSDDDQRSLIKKFLRLRGKQKSDEFETFFVTRASCHHVGHRTDENYPFVV